LYKKYFLTCTIQRKNSSYKLYIYLI